ncbi:MAG: BrnT family toxin [bacterium]|nr:BrnT family toxin [bacterium]
MALLPEFFPGITGFQWDEGNSEKNWRRHQVTQAEAEQVFFSRPVLVSGDPKHSGSEVRHFALGRTGVGRKLTVTLTLRGSLLRVISARPISRREGRVYGQAQGA